MVAVNDFCNFHVFADIKDSGHLEHYNEGYVSRSSDSSTQNTPPDVDDSRESNNRTQLSCESEIVSPIAERRSRIMTLDDVKRAEQRQVLRLTLVPDPNRDIESSESEEEEENLVYQYVYSNT